MIDAYGRGANTDEHVRCWRCNRMLFYYATRPWKIMCNKCKAQSQSPDHGFAGQDGFKVPEPPAV